MSMNLFQMTKPATRCYVLSIWIGIISGFVSALVKSGTEGIFPPRLVTEGAPPVLLLQNIGIDVTHWFYTYSEQIVYFGGNLVHIIFSIVWGVIYCFAAEIFPKIKMAQGLVFGLVVAILFHGIAMPVLGISTPVWDLRLQEIFSEVFGTALWIWIIEIMRRDLRNRFTKKADPEFQ
ncbi:putative membrane protein [Orbus hercynius]|uniref:Putative membrane protein n=1 Tax=Orbus hercynius TaxID=593135 RepID=A0A495RIY1_9GAMM|nr:DUF1440 domain-containing protein [Orbus hercynius]RKS87493.1 putative membrane protein [Orbus hercynius]